jgi:hypothetical protein
MKVFRGEFGKKIIANKGVQNLIYILLGVILFGGFELIKYGVLNNTFPVFLVFILLDILTMLKIAWEEYNPEKAVKFKWVWNKLFKYIKMYKKIKSDVNKVSKVN